MEPMRSSVCPLTPSPPWLPVLLPLSLRASRCQSPARMRVQQSAYCESNHTTFLFY